MQNRTRQARADHVVFSAESITNAPPLRNDQQGRALTVSIGNVDLPAFVSDGKLYIQAPLPHIFKAFAEDISAFVRDMEVRISGARGATLSLDRYGNPVYGATVVESRMVRRGRLS